MTCAGPSSKPADVNDSSTQRLSPPDACTCGQFTPESEQTEINNQQTRHTGQDSEEHTAAMKERKAEILEEEKAKSAKGRGKTYTRDALAMTYVHES